MEKDIGKEFIEFAVKTRYEDIPQETLQFTKYLTLKTVSGMLAGSEKPAGKKMAGMIKDQKLPQEVRVVGGGFKTSLWEAGFLQAFFAHASELEDDRFDEHEYGVSWDITVIPPVFAVADKLNLSGKALLEALAVGLEVHTRSCTFHAQNLGLMVMPGAVGPAIGVAKALGLGAKEMAGALGLGLSGVPLSVLSFGSEAHFFESALMSLQGLMAAEMAKAGLKGNPDLGTYLSLHLGKEKSVLQKMVDDLGKRWVLREIWIKKYPACFLMHPQIDSIIELKKEHNLTLDDVEVIEIHGGPLDTNCNRPDPKDENDIQFSFQNALSVAMLDGDVGLRHITMEAVDDPVLKEARKKVAFILHPELSSEIFKDKTKVVVKTKDGKSFTRERQYPLGHPTLPLTTEQFRGLYSKFTKGILSESDMSKTADIILNLEKYSTNDLMNIISLGG
ncbi:MAG: MmgE/PrpD family protein [Pseudomonadota bacterium]